MIGDKQRSKNYGISKIVYGEDNVESATCVLGDGLTRVASVGFDNGLCGVVLVRSINIESEPFQVFNGGESDIAVNQSPDDEKIYILFDNEKSIDALIFQLEESRKMLKTMCITAEDLK